MQIGEITEPKIDQTGPPPTGKFTYVDISSIDNLYVIGTYEIEEDEALVVEVEPVEDLVVVISGRWLRASFVRSCCTG